MAIVVVLNGTSSSGKTSIARAFQELAPGVFLNFSIDSILYALPPSIVERAESGKPTGICFLDMVAAFAACVRELAALGNDLIIDHAISTEEEVQLIRAALESHTTIFVGLECPVDVLTERERARGNRKPGMAAAQATRVHRWLEYDLTIDTSRVSVEDAARMIVGALPH